MPGAAKEVINELLAALITIVGWVHALLKPIGEWIAVSVLGAFEEITKSVVRGWFATGGRYVHQFSAFVLSVTGRQSYVRKRRKEEAARSQAWQTWWKDPRGTFNAIFERELAPGDAGATSPEVTSPPTSPPNRPSDSPFALGPLPPLQEIPPVELPSERKVSRWKFWRRVPSEVDIGLARGSVLFAAPLTSPLIQNVTRRGLFEDTRFSVEVGIGRFFAWLRNAVCAIFFIEKPPPQSPRGGSRGRFSRHGGRWQDLHMYTASDAILRAGYPLEEHSVTTSDGYVLTMHRIPRRGARDVAFFQHGVLDTSLGWVVGGTGGSAALEAHDSGFDVWLANTRANPPRVNVDPARQGAKYWHYSANELALCDVTAQVNHIHAIKLAELAATGVASGMKSGSKIQRSATVSCLGSGGGGTGGGGVDVSEEVTSPSRRKRMLSTCMKSIRTDSFDTSKVGQVDNTAPLRRSQSAAWADEGERARDASSPTLSSTSAGVGSLRPGSPVANESEIPLSQRSSLKTPPRKKTFQTDPEGLPYRLQAVGHSLGAAALLMYAVGCSMKGQPHHLRRLILLSPAGFHPQVPLAVRPCKYLMPWATALLDKFRPGNGMGLRLPSPVLRWITFKLMADLKRSPALLDLVKAGLRLATSGDKSEWHAAMELPHYAPQSMPAVSLHTACHFGQWAKEGNFRFYDYGSVEENQVHYGEDSPPSVADNYWRLADVPVDLAAGSSDGLIPPKNVDCHMRRLVDAGVRVTLREFDYGHLEFTFGVREEVSRFVLSKLRQSAWA